MYNTIIEFLKNIATNDFNHKNTASTANNTNNVTKG